MIGRIVLLALTFAMTGCPSSEDEATVVETCTKTGEKCRIGDGQLGVCMMSSAGDFHCASQH